MSKADLRAEFEEAVGRFNPVREGTREFRIATKIGLLDVRLYDDRDGAWIAARWSDSKAAAKHFGVKSFMSGDRLNPCSGKWNWHWWEFWPHGIKSKAADRRQAGQQMIVAFVQQLDQMV